MAEPEPSELEPSEPAPDAVSEVIVLEDEVTSGRLAPGPIVTEVIDREAITDSGATTAAGALAGRPGLWLERGRAGVSVSMQGLGAEYVVVLVDGQRQLGRVDGALDLEQYSAGELDRIDVMRGPGAVMYGSDAIAGVISLTSRPVDEERASVAARADHRGAASCAAPSPAAPRAGPAGCRRGGRAPTRSIAIPPTCRPRSPATPTPRSTPAPAATAPAGASTAPRATSGAICARSTPPPPARCSIAAT